MARSNFDDDRAKKTLYVTGFDPDKCNKKLLEELFTQGGPLTEIILFDTHAYVQFVHQESVPYCLALFQDLELHGNKLRISPRHKSTKAFEYIRYLSDVRKKLMSEFRKIPPPKLPPKRYTQSKRSTPRKKRSKPQSKPKTPKFNFAIKRNSELKNERSLEKKTQQVRNCDRGPRKKRRNRGK